MEATEIHTYTATAVDVSKHFAVSRATVYGWVSSTDIPHRKIRGVIRFNMREVDKWAAERPG